MDKHLSTIQTAPSPSSAWNLPPLATSLDISKRARSDYDATSRRLVSYKIDMDNWGTFNMGKINMTALMGLFYFEKIHPSVVNMFRTTI